MGLHSTISADSLHTGIEVFFVIVVALFFFNFATKICYIQMKQMIILKRHDSLLILERQRRLPTPSKYLEDPPSYFLYEHRSFLRAIVHYHIKSDSLF